MSPAAALAVPGAILAALVLAACGGQQTARGIQSTRTTQTSRATTPEAIAPTSIPGPRRVSGTSCDRVAATNGNDSNPGTASAPFATAQRLADSLSAGQTGCLRTGAYPGGLRVATSDVSVASYPGEQATISGKTYLTESANRVRITDLNLVSGVGTGQFVNGTGDVFDHVDVTSNNTENCFIVGSSDPAYGRASGLVIENSRIHNCGQLHPDTNMDHGIYVDAADGTVIRDNWIYGNADRGIQLYPDARRSEIYGNVIAFNGEGIAIAGDGATASSDNRIQGNVIADSRVRWNVEADWPKGLVGTGNVVRDNCVWNGGGNGFYDRGGGVIPSVDPQLGFTATGNVVANPRFADPGAGDLRLAAASACDAVQGE